MYLYGQTANGAAPSNMLIQLIPFVVIFAIFYLLIIMPARKKQKQHQSMVDSLKGGERVIIAGGIYGTVSRVLGDRFEIQVADNTRIQVVKNAVSNVLVEGGETAR